MKRAILSGLLLSCSLFGMQPPAKPLARQIPANAASSPEYSNENRVHIIKIAGRLTYGHLLFPVGDSIFKASIKHAFLDGVSLCGSQALQSPVGITVAQVVAMALTNLSRTIEQFCPKKDFLESLETMLEQMDDRYNEEAKSRSDDPVNLDKKIVAQLSYAVGHYEELTKKNLEYMVEMDRPAAKDLQEKLDKIPEATILKWFEQAKKTEPVS